MDDKYVVFKKADWDKYVNEMLVDSVLAAEAERVILDDAVVIRIQDVFATGGLWAYCHNIRTFIELEDRLGQGESEQCERTARYFADRATEAQAILEAGKAKLPD